ncbi:MAG: DNA repair protein RecO [Chloroflexota bacterium]|nr:DNA repair protein RecO [Chloroflexota bacterium]
MSDPSARRQRLYRTEAIVLKRRDYGEADRILTLFTPEYGKLVVLGKGIRKTKSRKAGHLESLIHSNLLIARGRTWDLVTQADTIESFSALRNDLLRTSYAFYVAELLDAFTQEQDAHPSLFELLRRTLGRLAAGTVDQLPLAARFYELHLLALAGYQPQLFYCATCQERLEPITNFFSSAAGGVLCPQHGEGQAGAEPLSLPVFKALRFLQTRDWETVARLKLSQSGRNDIERLLQSYIVYQLERNLRSVGFMRILRDHLNIH